MFKITIILLGLLENVPLEVLFCVTFIYDYFAELNAIYCMNRICKLTIPNRY